MRHPILVLSIALTALPAAGQPTQEEGQQLCPVDDVTGLTMLPPLNPPIAGAEVRKALMVCVTFPNMVENFIPSWIPPMAGEGIEGELEEYVREVSGGHQVLDITLERRPAPFQNDAYMADEDDWEYADLPGPFGGHGILNAEILLDVLANHAFEDPDYLQQFDLIFMVYNGNPYSEDFGGIAQLNLPFGFPFAGQGYSVRILNPGDEEGEINRPVNQAHSRWVQVHEYGHLLGFGHTAHSDPEDDCRKKLGRYDPMQHSVPVVSEWDLHSYHVMNLLQKGWIDPERVIEPPAPTGQFYYTLGDVRRGGEILKVTSAEYDQGREYFLVVNHQGSDFDAKYLGTGLAIWHIREGGIGGIWLWDLEVASGMFAPNCAIPACPPTQCTPDPIGGTDTLDRTGRAGACDLWSSGTFGPATNPNSNSYQPVICPVQKANSGITITGIADLGSEMELQLFLASAPPPVTVSVDVPAQSFLGLDCDSAQELALPIEVIVYDSDGTPLGGVPSGWTELLLTPVSVPGGTLSFCGVSSFSPATTDATGFAGGTLYHACGGGEFEASFELLGSEVASSVPAQLRTPDLDADGSVDGDDLEIWSHPSGPPEDDIRDLNFDLAIDQDDLDLLSSQMNTVLEPDVTMTALAPAPGAELAVGTTVSLLSDACASGDEVLVVSYEDAFQGTFNLIGMGPELDTLDWLVAPPRGSHELWFRAECSLGSAVEIVPVTVVAPKIAISVESYHPMTLNTIGAMGEVFIKLKNNETIPVSDITAEFASGALGIVAGPLPAGPYDFTPGRIHTIKWVVVRTSGTGTAQAEIKLRLDGHPDVIKSKTITVFGPTGG